ncbi:hypothetical protein KM043_017368 [Ampulex compressa]|nr:hypothetical protein KM043_017368 [Ampulex compressa]
MNEHEIAHKMRLDFKDTRFVRKDCAARYSQAGGEAFVSLLLEFCSSRAVRTRDTMLLTSKNPMSFKIYRPNPVITNFRRTRGT